MKRLIGIASSIVILILLCSGVFADLVRFFAWLFTLQYAQPETSIAGGIIVRLLTFIVSYGLVGLVFSVFGWFNSKVMSIAYFIISTLLGFALAYVVWMIEKHILIVGIIFGAIVLAVITFFIIQWIIGRNKTQK